MPYIAREHPCNTAPIELLADIICYSACFYYWLLLVWWCSFGTFPHQSHSLFVILHRILESLCMQLLSLPAFHQVDSWFDSCNKGIHPEMPDSSSSVHVLFHTLLFIAFVCPSYWFLADLSFYRSSSWLSLAQQASLTFSSRYSSSLFSCSALRI